MSVHPDPAMTATELSTGWLSPLELVSGMPRGTDPQAGPLPRAQPGLSARGALERVVREALRRPPCVVSFSGGRDSSAILALAADVAGREGLAPPIAVTLTFPGCPDAGETEWQELVLRYLGVEDWVRLPFDDELDVVGPHAQTVFRACGPLWPANVHSHLPIAEHAHGGTMLTGFGGDELLTTSPRMYRVNSVISGQAHPTVRDLPRFAACYGPGPVRRAGARRLLRGAPPRPWLRREAARAVRAAEVRYVVQEPVRWDRAVDEGWWRSRYRGIGVRSLEQVAGVHGARVCSPFAEAAVLAAMACEGGRAGFASRTAAMQYLVGDLLPPDVIGRVSKAAFGQAFWSTYAQEFARTWDGSGVDHGLVDVDVLRRIWNAPDDSDVRTFALFQAAWIARHA